MQDFFLGIRALDKLQLDLFLPSFRNCDASFSRSSTGIKLLLQASFRSDSLIHSNRKQIVFSICKRNASSVHQRFSSIALHRSWIPFRSRYYFSNCCSSWSVLLTVVKNHLLDLEISCSLKNFSLMATSSSVVPSSGFAAPILISNIGSMLSIKLENCNYLLWKSQFLPVLCANNLEGFVDGSPVCPSTFLLNSEGKTTSEINPHFSQWIQQDQNVL